MITARTVEPNKGIERQFSSKMRALNRAMLQIVREQVLLHLDNQGALALDSLTNPKTEKEKKQLEDLEKKVLSSLQRANPEAIKADIQAFVQASMHKWVKAYSVEALKICDWMVRNIVYSTTAAQRRSLIAAGLPKGQFRKWTVPLINNQYISAQAQVQAEQLKEQLHTDMNSVIAKRIDKLADTMGELLAEGKTASEARPELDKTTPRFAKSYCNTVSQAIQRANASEIGITEAIWVHVPGEFTSRDTHIKMNGKKFKLDEGLYDEDVKQNVVPGLLSYCRCVQRVILPKELTDDEDTSI